jgi:hydrogenase maturation factor HypE
MLYLLPQQKHHRKNYRPVKEQGVRYREQGVGSREQGAGSRGQGKNYLFIFLSPELLNS